MRYFHLNGFRTLHQHISSVGRILRCVLSLEVLPRHKAVVQSSPTCCIYPVQSWSYFVDAQIVRGISKPGSFLAGSLMSTELLTVASVHWFSMSSSVSRNFQTGFLDFSLSGGRLKIVARSGRLGFAFILSSRLLLVFLS